MARSDKRYSVYPAPKAVEVLGNSAPALNRAIECWAALLARATADNAKKLWNDVHRNGIKEWCVLADTLKEMLFTPEFANPGELLATAVEDVNRLENIGSTWLEMEIDDGYNAIEQGDQYIALLVQKLRDLDYAHAWAVIVAVQWFWEHHDQGIDVSKDDWWTLAFRRQWQMKTAKKSTKQRR
jgi:hypothetical protein